MKNKLNSLFIGLALLAGVDEAAAQTAQSAAASDITGVYNGSYEGPNGTMRFKLTLTGPGLNGRLTGAFTSYLAGSSDTLDYTNDLVGAYYMRGHRFQLSPSYSRTVRFSRLAVRSIAGTYDPEGGQLSGTILIPGSGNIKFEAARDATESAKLPTPAVSHASEPQAAAPPRSRAVRQIVPRPVARPVAQAVEPTLPPLDAPKLSSPSDIAGIFLGNCIVGKDTRPLKLQLEKSGNGDLRGIFTSYFPQSHGEACRCTLRGSCDPSSGKVKLEPLQAVTGYWEMTGLEGMFDPSTGRLAGNLTAGKRGPFEVLRNEAETEKVATAMNGVYTSSYLYLCGFPGPSVGFKLSLKGAINGAVTGYLNLVLPPEQGSRATFKLDGTYTIDNQLLSQETLHFHNQPLSLKATTWGPPAPPDYMVKKIVCIVHPGPETMSCTFYANRSPEVVFPARATPAPADLDRVMATQCEEATNQVLVAQYAKLVAAAKSAKAAREAEERAVEAKRLAAIPTIDTTHGMEIQLFDRMSDQDQAEYADQLAQSVQDGVAPDQYDKVKAFFAPREQGDGASGMRVFKSDLALVRVADLEMAHDNPAMPRSKIEYVLMRTLQKNGIVLPKDFMPRAANFHPTSPLKPPMSLADAEKAAASSSALVNRLNGTAVPRAELENPKDASWVDKFDFVDPKLIKALFTGDFSHVNKTPSQVLIYILALNENLQPACSNLYDKAITAAGERSGQLGILRGNRAGLPSGSTSPLRIEAERIRMDLDSGATDAHTLITHAAPEGCDSVILKNIYRNMKIYAHAH